MSIKEHGIKKYGRMVEQNVDQARHLVTLIEASPELELLAPVPLNVVCFRFVDNALDDAQLSSLNQQILIELQETGVAVPSSTTLGGKFALRVAITNHRSIRSDFELLTEKVIEIGRSLKHTAEPSAPSERMVAR
jgi:glutamate/tyrosine decarboxylase-like PLP-dependent enzyme